MNKIDSHIVNIDKVICGNISKFDYSERDLLCQNLLPQLRNLVEHISLKLYSNGQEIPNSWENIQSSIKFVKTKGDLKFLSQFHQLLQISTSHYTLDGDNSERLMLKYYEYLHYCPTKIQHS